MECPTREDLIQLFITLKQEDVDRAFKKGEVAHYLVQMGDTYQSIATDTKCSSEQVRVLTKTYETFPTEEDRPYAELDFYHYRLAATTDKPHYWLQEASKNEWSTRELQKAIKDEPVLEEYRQAERLIFNAENILKQENHVSKWLLQKMDIVVTKYKYAFDDIENVS